MAKMRVAVTGGIGSGKSTAASCINAMGYPVFSCDEIYNEVITSQDYIDEIKAFFPAAVINNEINRNILSKIVFNDEKKRRKLNELSHPLVMKKLEKYMDKAEGHIVFAEVPLLFEGNFENRFDHVIVIARNTDVRISAVSFRDGSDVKDVKKRIQAQFDYTSSEGVDKLKKCNAHILKNDGNILQLSEKLKQLILQFK